MPCSCSSPTTPSGCCATIRSRLAPVPFRRLRRAELEALTGDPVAARAALGDAGRAERLATDADAAARRRGYLELARACFADPGFDPAAAAARSPTPPPPARPRPGARSSRRAQRSLRESRTSASAARSRSAPTSGPSAPPGGHEPDELREAVDVVGLWYRDLMATALGGEGAVIDSDVAGELAQDARVDRPRKQPGRSGSCWRLVGHSS